MSVLLFAYVCMLTAFETLSLLLNLVNKESESESEIVSVTIFIRIPISYYQPPYHDVIDCRYR